MLCITRRVGECVKAGDVIVRLHKIRGKQARLLIDAPPDVIIDRLDSEYRIQKQRDEESLDDESSI